MREPASGAPILAYAYEAVFQYRSQKRNTFRPSGRSTGKNQRSTIDPYYAALLIAMAQSMAKCGFTTSKRLSLEETDHYVSSTLISCHSIGILELLRALLPPPPAFPLPVFPLFVLHHRLMFYSLSTRSIRLEYSALTFCSSRMFSVRRLTASHWSSTRRRSHSHISDALTIRTRHYRSACRSRS